MESKPISYRGWRKKSARRLWLGRKPPRPLAGQGPETGKAESGPGAGDNSLEMLAYHLQWEKMRMQQLAQELTGEYFRHDIFREARVAQLKYFLKHGLYHIPGCKIVERWFPKTPGKDSLD